LTWQLSIGCQFGKICSLAAYYFHFQVDTYEKIYDEVEEFEGTVIFEKWFRVDSRPFKQALLNIIKRWSFMFKQHLIDHVTNRYIIIASFSQFSLKIIFHMP